MKKQTTRNTENTNTWTDETRQMIKLARRGSDRGATTGQQQRCAKGHQCGQAQTCHARRQSVPVGAARAESSHGGTGRGCGDMAQDWLGVSACAEPFLGAAAAWQRAVGTVLILMLRRGIRVTNSSQNGVTSSWQCVPVPEPIAVLMMPHELQSVWFGWPAPICTRTSRQVHTSTTCRHSSGMGRVEGVPVVASL